MARGCRVCGTPVEAGQRYCPPCDDEVREMVDELDAYGRGIVEVEPDEDLEEAA